jgi:hypothetical protein
MTSGTIIKQTYQRYFKDFGFAPWNELQQEMFEKNDFLSFWCKRDYKSHSQNDH